MTISNYADKDGLKQIIDNVQKSADERSLEEIDNTFSIKSLPNDQFVKIFETEHPEGVIVDNLEALVDKLFDYVDTKVAEAEERPGVNNDFCYVTYYGTWNTNSSTGLNTTPKSVDTAVVTTDGREIPSYGQPLYSQLVSLKEHRTSTVFGWTTSSLSTVNRIEFLDYFKVTHFDYWFSGMKRDVTIVNFDNVDHSEVVSVRHMFSECSNNIADTIMGNIDFNNWDFTLTEDMSHLLENNATLTTIDNCKNIDVSKVKNMDAMFSGCAAITEMDLSAWNPKAATTMKDIFKTTTKLATLDLSNWELTTDIRDNIVSTTDTNKNIRYYFFYNNHPALTTLKINNWKFPEGTTILSHFLYYFTTLTTVEVNNLVVEEMTDISYLFYNCSKLTTITGINTWDTTNIQKFNDLFYSCVALTQIDLTNFVKEAATNIEHMFYNCSKLVTITGLDTWDVSNVTTMNALFYSCTVLKDVTGTEDWDMSSVTNLESMFNGCVAITQYDATDLVTSAATTIKNLFYGCKLLSTFSGADTWDTTNVTDMTTIFYGCAALRTLDISNWNTKSVTAISAVCSGCTALTEVNMSSWYISNGLTGKMFNTTNLNSCFGFSALKKLNISKWTFDESIESLKNLLYGTNAVTDLDMSDWTITEKLIKMLTGSTSNCIYEHLLVQNKTRSGSNALTNFNISNWKIPSTTESLAYMYYNLDAIVNFEVSEWDTSHVTSMQSMFQACKDLETLSGVKDWDVFAVTNTSYMFYNDTKFSDINSVLAWGDKTHSITNTRYMFYHCDAFTSLDFSYWSLDSIQDMYCTFQDCTNLTDINLSNMNISTVTNMEGLFYNDQKLEHIIGLDTWDVSNATTFRNMLYNCLALEEINLSNWDVSNCIENMTKSDSATFVKHVFATTEFTKDIKLNLSNWSFGEATDLSFFLSGFPKLKELNISNWDLTKVTTASKMLYGDIGLEKINMSGWKAEGLLPNIAASSSLTIKGHIFGGTETTNKLHINASNWDLGEITTLTYLFYDLSETVEIDVSGWDVSKITNINFIFQGCTVLTHIIGLEEWNTDHMENMQGIFHGCAALAQINLSGWDFHLIMKNMCGDTNKTLKSVLFSGYSATVPLDLNLDNCVFLKQDSLSYIFSGMTNLASISINGWNVKYTTDFSHLFEGDTNLRTIIGLNRWDLSNATNLESMFKGCSSLYELNLSNWNVKNVIEHMAGSSSNTLNTYLLGSGSSHFNGALTLDLSNWDIGECTNLSYMFNGETGIKYLNLSGWNVESITDMKNMFSGMTQLEIINLNDWNPTAIERTAENKNFTNLFSQCTSLKTIYATEDWANEQDTENPSPGVFTNCTKLVGAIEYNAEKVDSTYLTLDTGYFSTLSESEYVPLKNLKDGDIVRLAQYSGGAIDWLVVGQNHFNENNTTSVLSQYVLCEKSRDAHETKEHDESYYFKSYGNGDWYYSCIRQWLNSRKFGHEWWQSQYDTDTPPSASYVSSNPYDLERGFLNYWSPADIKYLYMTDRQYASAKTSHGYVNKTESTDQVFLPTYTEVKGTDSSWSMTDPDGTALEMFTDNASRIAYNRARAANTWMLQSTRPSQDDCEYIKVTTGGAFAGSDDSSATLGGIRPAISVINTMQVKKDWRNIYQLPTETTKLIDKIIEAKYLYDGAKA